MTVSLKVVLPIIIIGLIAIIAAVIAHRTGTPAATHYYGHARALASLTHYYG